MMEFFVNMPLSWIADDRTWLSRMISMGLRPELGLDARSMDEQGEDWHRGVAAELRDAGLACTVHLPFLDLVPGSPDRLMRAASLERLTRAAKLAAVHAPAACIGHAAYSEAHYADCLDQWLDNAAATWLAFDAAWPDHPPVYLENVFETSPGPIVALVERLPKGRFGLCLDVGHWHCFSGGHAKADPARDLARWLDALAPRLGHLHLHDNDGSFDQHLGLGRGTIPLEALFQGLAERELAARGLHAGPGSGREIGVTLEPHTEADLAASLDWLAARAR